MNKGATLDKNTDQPDSIKSIQQGRLCEIETTSIIKKSLWQNLENAILISRLILLTIDFDIYTDVALSKSVVLNWGSSLLRWPPINFKASASSYTLQNGKFDQ